MRFQKSGKKNNNNNKHKHFKRSFHRKVERRLIVLWTISLLVIIIFLPGLSKPQDLSKNFIVHETGYQKLFWKTTALVWTLTPFEVISLYARNACYRYSFETVNRRGMKPSPMSSTNWEDPGIYSLQKYSVTPSMSYCPWKF